MGYYSYAQSQYMVESSLDYPSQWLKQLAQIASLRRVIALRRAEETCHYGQNQFLHLSIEAITRSESSQCDSIMAIHRENVS